MNEEAALMQTAKLFVNGRSQAVRLPRGFNFKGTDVFIQKVGDSIILFPKDKVWETFLSGLNRFTDDFMANGREQPEMQDRDEL